MRYFVENENTIVYHIQNNMYGVLASSVLRGGRDWMTGPVHLMETEIAKLRPVTKDDFDTYRVYIA